MARKVFGFLAYSFAKPVADEWAVDVVVVNPAFVAGVVRWVNVDALDLTGVLRQQPLEPNQIVALHDEIAAAVIAAGQFRHVLEQTKRNLVVMIHHLVFPNPVQCRHILALDQTREFSICGGVISIALEFFQARLELFRIEFPPDFKDLISGQ